MESGQLACSLEGHALQWCFARTFLSPLQQSLNLVLSCLQTTSVCYLHANMPAGVPRRAWKQGRSTQARPDSRLRTLRPTPLHPPTPRNPYVCVCVTPTSEVGVQLWPIPQTRRPDVYFTLPHSANMCTLGETTLRRIGRWPEADSSTASRVDASSKLPLQTKPSQGKLQGLRLVLTRLRSSANKLIPTRPGRPTASPAASCQLSQIPLPEEHACLTPPV